MKNLETIKIINDYVSKFLWMDFYFDVIDMNIIKIIGTTDVCYPNETAIEIIFEGNLSIKAILDVWSKNDDTEFIKIENGETCKRVFGFSDEKETLFSLSADWYEDSPIYICADTIKYNILRHIN